MKSTFLWALALATESFAADQICYQGVYGQIQPIFNWAPAQQFCGGQYPASTVTVTRGRGGFYKRAPVPSTTTSSSAGKAVAASASASGSASVNANFARPVTTTSSSTSGDPRPSMWSSVSRGDRGVLFTFCSCIQNHPTVTIGSTTTSTATTSSSSSSITTTSTSTTLSSTVTTSSSSTSTTSAVPSCTPGTITANDGTVYNVQCNFNYFGGNTNKRSNNIITYYQGVANLAACAQSCEGTPGCAAVDYYRTAQGTGANQLAGDCFLLSNTNLGGGGANGIDAATRVAATTSTTSSTATTTSSSTSTATSSSTTTSSSTQSTTSSSTATTTSSSTSMTTSSSTTSSSTTTTSSSAATCTPGTFTAQDGAVFNRQCNFNYAGGNFVITYIQAIASLEACIQKCDGTATCAAVDFYRIAQGTGVNQLAGDCFLLTSTAAGGAALVGVDAAFKVISTTTSSSTTSMTTTTSSSSTTTSSTTSTTTSAVPCPTGCDAGFFCDTTTPGGACRPSGNCNANAGQCPDNANCNAGGCYCQPDASGQNGYCQTGGDCGTQYCSKNSDCPAGTICFVSCCDQNFCVNPLTADFGANNCPNPASRLFAIRGASNDKRQGKKSSAKPIQRKPSVDYSGWYNRHH